jgi:stage V sporulation protein B
MAAQSDAGARAGRGFVSITGAKLYFIVAGYAVQLSLPRLFGTPELFGLYSAAMSVVSILNNVLIAATIQTVSKRVSEDVERAPYALREGLTLQLGVGLLIAGSLLVSAPVLAGDVLLDPLLTPLLRIASVVVLGYSLYAALVGSLNGRQMFGRQAALDATYTTLRTVGIVGAAAAGFGVVGAIAGFATAATAVLTIAAFTVGLGRGGKETRWKPWIAFMAPLWMYQLFLNLTLQVDLTLLKRTIAELGLAAGQAPAIAAETASRYAGIYRAAQTFSFVPYQVILAVAFVVFPMVSASTVQGDLQATRAYIRAALRFSLLVLVALAAPIAGASAGVMRIAYPDAYLVGADALSVLSLGMACFALFVVGATVLNGAGRPGLSAAIGGSAVIVLVGLNIAFVRAAGVGDEALLAAASATSTGTALALAAVGLALWLRFGAFLAPFSTLRILGCGTVGFAVARAMPSHSALWALAALCAGGIAYLAALAISRELGETDLAIVRKVLKK